MQEKLKMRESQELHGMQEMDGMQGIRKAQRVHGKWLGCVRRFLAAGIILTAFGVIPCGVKVEEPSTEQRQYGGAVQLAQSRAVLHVQAAQDTFGELDSFTGELMTPADDAGAGQTTSNKVWITGKMYYDREKKLFGYYAGDEDVYATVADGMIVRGTVNIQIPENLTATLYLDGYPAEFTGGELETPGSYTLEITNAGQTTQLFSYWIVKGITNQVLNYTMPEGFRLTDATRNGEAANWSRNFIDMTEEGRYIVSYECTKTGEPYTLDVTVDTTPPTLVLEGVDEKGKARGPVAITGKAEEDTLVVTKDGKEYSMVMARVLTQTGRYEATVTDPAGNSTVYPFAIMIYLDRNGAIFGLLFLGVVITVVALYVYYKKHLRVR